MRSSRASSRYPIFFWGGDGERERKRGGGEKRGEKSKRFRESTGSRSNGRPLSMMSTKVSTVCNGFLIAKQLHGTRFSFVQLLVFDAYRYGLLTLSMGNARFFFFLPLRVRFSRLIRVFFFPFSLFRCFFFLSLFFWGRGRGTGHVESRNVI